MPSDLPETTRATVFPRGFARDTDWQWPMVPARNLVTLNYGRSLTARSRRQGTVPVYGTNGQCGWHDTPLTKGPGLILGRKGQGPLGVEWCEKDFWTIDTAYYVSTIRPDVDLKYIYHLVKFVGLNHLKDGTSNPTLSREVFGAQLLPLPGLVEQKAIAATLGTFDDKITLLRETNATLEAIAQALFKSWFVDFDPVRAKAEGRDPVGVPPEVADLFASEFEDSELGEIPKAWRVHSLDSFATYLNGLALQKYPPESDDDFLPVIKIAQLRAGNTLGADRASALLKPEYIVRDGDVLFSWSGSLEVEIWCGGEGALNQHLFKVTSNEVPKWFYYLATRHFLPSFRETAAHKATTMGHIQRKHLTESRLALPPTGVLAALSDFVGPIVEKRITNSLQARGLGTLRDTLLPRLMSGKLRIPEIQAAVEEAAP